MVTNRSGHKSNQLINRTLYERLIQYVGKADVIKSEYQPEILSVNGVRRLVKVTRIQAGRYSVDDGRSIVKQGSNWHVINANGAHDFGPVPTLASAKQYVESGVTLMGQHNLSTTYGRRQSKKEFNAYLASEAKNGNLMPAILWCTVISIICGVVFVIRGY